MLRFLLKLCLICALFGGVLAGGSVSAQVPFGPTLTPPKSLLSPPKTALIQLNSQILFSVHTSGDQRTSGGQSAQDRADLANLRLADALRDVSGGRSTALAVTVGVQNGQTVLLLGPKLLLTVTDADTDATSKPAGALAEAWAAGINRALAQAARERQPAFLRWALAWAGGYLLLGVAVNTGLQVFVRRTGYRPGWPVQALLWLLVFRQVINLLPQTRPFYLLLVTGTLRPLVLILAIGLPAAVLVRLWGVVLRRLFPPLPEYLSPQDRTERTYQRRITLARVAEVTGATLLWTVAGIVLVSGTGLNISALLASAGLIGVVLSIVTQDSLKDFVAGIYILTDDRFGVGDTVQIGAYEGRVEKLNLRATQIRDMSGRLITISNRSIVDVANLTARWAQVDFRIGVSYYADLTEAQRLLQETACALADEWPERVLAPPELLGVDSFTDLSVILRLTLRTPPGDQWVVGRELRVRVKTAFDAANIAILNNLYPPPPAPVHTPPPDA